MRASGRGLERQSRTFGGRQNKRLHALRMMVGQLEGEVVRTNPGQLHPESASCVCVQPAARQDGSRSTATWVVAAAVVTSSLPAGVCLKYVWWD